MIDLNKKRASILAITVVVIVFVSITVVVPVAMSSTLAWSITPGDKASYRVMVNAWQLNVSYVVPPPSRYALLDGVNISAEIVALPELGWFLNGVDFAEKVIRTEKVNVTFQNGTSIPDDISVLLKFMLSSCILPTDAWQFIDTCYPDTYPTGPGADTYWSYSSTSSFQFGYYGSGIDSITQMSSRVSYETGLPEAVSYFYSHGVDSVYNLTILQI